MTTLPQDIKDQTLSTYQQILKLGREEGIEQGIEQGLEQGIEQNKIESSQSL